MASPIKCALYVVANIFSVFVVLIFVFYANSFLNEFFLPTGWSYRADIILRVLVALTEAAVLICITHVGNRLIASVLFARPQLIARWTSGLSFAFVLVVVMISAYDIFRQGL